MRRNSVSRSKGSGASFFQRPALVLSAGLFVWASGAHRLHGSDEERIPRALPPKVVFFWQETDFFDLHRPLLPFLRIDEESEGFRIPELPAPGPLRFQLDEIADSSLAPAPETERIEFRETYLRPLESFLVRADGPAGIAEPDDEPRLTLRDALHHAFATNPSILVRDLQTRIERERIAQAEAMFAPVTELSGEMSRSRFPQNAAEASALNLFPLNDEPRVFYSRNEALRAALKGETPYGTQYETYSSLTINESTLTRTSPVAVYEEEYTTNAGFRLTQPLLRGYGYVVQEAPIRIARINRRIAAAELRAELTALAVETLEAYFQLIDAVEVREIRLWEQETYRKLAEIVQRKVETGDAGPRDLVRIDIRLARVQDRILQANEQLENARHRLFGIFGTDFPFHRYANVRPVGEMSPYIPDLSPETAAHDAIQSSAEVERFRHQLDRDRENMMLARDEARSSLNLVGGVELRGLGDGPYSSARYGVENTPLGYNVGLIYSRPWGNHAAEARVREARTSVRQTELQIAQAERSVRHRLTGEINRLRLLEDRFANISDLLRHVGEEIRTESRLLETGETSLASLLEFYEELFQIRIQAIGVLREINVAKARYWAAGDDLLPRLGIEYRDSDTVHNAPPGA